MNVTLSLVLFLYCENAGEHGSAYPSNIAQSQISDCSIRILIHTRELSAETARFRCIFCHLLST